MASASPVPGATPNVRHLMLFDQVVRRGSVSAAARAAHLSQPAVTQAVGHIEAALGARLMQRSYTGLALTGAGRAAAQRVDRALQMLREALVAVRTRSAHAASGDVLRGITSTQLKALIAVVEAGAFARAARRAGRARAAVHRAARQLEKSLGTDLFEVTSFGVRPTREAEKLALRTRLAFAEIAQAQAEVAAAQGTGSGATVIGAMPLARSVLVARAVLEFAAARPEHGISILDGPYESMLGALRRGSADVLVGALRDPIPSEDIVQEHLFDDPLAIVVGAQHALASDRVMLLSEHQIQHELATGQLVALPHPFGAVTRSIGLTVRRDWRPTQVQAQLVEGLRRHARAASSRQARPNSATA